MKKCILIFISLLVLALNGCSSGNSNSNNNSNDNNGVLEAIEVTPAITTIPQGIDQQFTATGIYSNSTTKDITDQVVWSSTESNVAFVNGKNTAGLVKAKIAGSTTIVATLGSLSGDSKVKVSIATLTSISVTNPDPILAIGFTDQLTATGIFSDNSTKNITKQVAWTSSNPNVSVVEESGVIDALTVGDTIITAQLNSVKGDTKLKVTNATLESVAITPVNPSLPLGVSEQLTVIGIYSDNSKQDITNQVIWSSSNTTVATVNAGNGLLNAIGKGNSVITASVNGISTTTNVSVTDSKLISIAITPVNSAIPAGINEQLTATGTYSDNSTNDITNQVVWRSNNPAIAIVSNALGNNGLLSSLAMGNSTISASANGVSATTTVTVTSALLTSITITPANPSLPLGSREPLTATGTYSDSSTKDITNQVTWSSANKDIVAVSNAVGSQGVIVASSVGNNIKIQAILNGVSASTSVTVTSAVLKSITIIPATPKLPLGLTEQLSATGIYSDSSTKDLTREVTWDSDTPTIAVVSNANKSNGLVTSLATGNTVISASLNGITGTTNLMVTNAALKSIDITPANLNMPLGFKEQLTATGVYTDNSTKDLTTQVIWSSNNTGIAVISNASGSKGLITSIAIGNATINASLTGISSSINLTVSNAILQSIDIMPVNSSIPLGLTEQFTAKGIYSDSTTKDLTTQVTWSSGTPQVAVISNGSNRGLLTSLTVGNSTITATLNGVSQTTNVSITGAILQSINITPVNLNLPLGLTQQFTAAGVYSDGTTKDITAQVTWNSTNTAAAIISNVSSSKGKLTSVAVGTTTIQASLAGVSQTTQINVNAAILQSITISSTNPSISAGLTTNFTATGTYSDGSTKLITNQVTWSSGTPNVATISNASGSYGLATTLKQGSTIIKAILGNISQTTTLTVTPAILRSISVTPGSANILIGTTVQLTATATFSDNSTQNYTNQANWTSSNAGSVTINSSGLAAATYTAGNATITVSSGGFSSTATINVKIDQLVNQVYSNIAANGKATIDYTGTPIAMRIIFSDGSGNIYGFGGSVVYTILAGYYDNITGLAANGYDLWIANSASVGGSMNHQSTTNISSGGNNRTDAFNDGNWPQVTVAGSPDFVYYGDQRGNIWKGWVSDSDRIYDGPSTVVTAITYNPGNQMIYFAEGTQIFSLNPNNGAVATIVSNTQGNTVTVLLTDPQQNNLYFNKNNQICSINPYNLGAGVTCSLPNQTGNVIAFAWDNQYNRLVALTTSKVVFVSYPSNGNLNNSSEILINYVNNVSGTNGAVLYDNVGKNSYIIDSSGAIYKLVQNLN